MVWCGVWWRVWRVWGETLWRRVWRRLSGERTPRRRLSGELSLERSSPERSSPEDTPEDTPHTHPLSSNPRPHDPKRGIPTLLTRGKREEEKGGLHTQILKISLGENPQTPLNYPRTDLRSGEKTRRGGARVSRAIRQNR